MYKEEFKLKYFTDCVYTVDKENYELIQQIGIEFGCICHTGKKEKIHYHKGFTNLGFRTYDRYNGVTRFQKEGIVYKEDLVSYKDMLLDYKKMTPFDKLDKSIRKSIDKHIFKN